MITATTIAIAPKVYQAHLTRHLMRQTSDKLKAAGVSSTILIRAEGMETYLQDLAISGRDYPTVQGIMVFSGAIVVLASIAIYIINALIDPRIRY